MKSPLAVLLFALLVPSGAFAKVGGVILLNDEPVTGANLKQLVDKLKEADRDRSATDVIYSSISYYGNLSEAVGRLNALLRSRRKGGLISLRVGPVGTMTEVVFESTVCNPLFGVIQSDEIWNPSRDTVEMEAKLAAMEKEGLFPEVDCVSAVVAPVAESLD